MQADRSHVAFLPHIDRLGLDPEEIVALGETFHALTQTKGWDVLTGLIEAEIQNVRNQIEWPNHPLEHTQYAILTGRVRGLQQFKGAVDAVQVAAERAAEHQRQIVAQLSQEHNA